MLTSEFTTIAQTKNLPQRVRNGGLEKRKLFFGIDGKIDLFNSGGTEATPAPSNPDDLNFDFISKHLILTI